MRTDNNPLIDQGSSQLFSEIEGSSSAALVGMAGAMNHLISKIQPPYNAQAAKEATRLIIVEPHLLEDEQVILCIYYGKNIPEAAALSDMGGKLRSAVFRKILEGVPPDFLSQIHA
jgi:hypothetical protein